jgi:transcriptional regulator with XRE-family HTH domain
MTHAARIRALRTTLRLSQRELADEWGLSPGAIARWETGSNPVPGPVQKLLEIYEGELSGAGPLHERDSSFLARGFNGIVAYGAWVFFGGPSASPAPHPRPRTMRWRASSRITSRITAAC